MAEFEEEVSLNAIFKKKKTTRTKDKSTLRKSTDSGLVTSGLLPATLSSQSVAITDPEHLAEAEGNVVISRKIKKQNSIHKTKSSSSLKTKFSLGNMQDEADDSLESRIETPRQKLLRPTLHASLNSLGDDQAPMTSSPMSNLAQASRPTYSTSHLNELKSLTLSASPNQTPSKEAYDPLTESKFGAFLDDDMDVDQSFDSAPSGSMAIPTSSMISSAKERRSHARKAGLTAPTSSRVTVDSTNGEDFISLSGNNAPMSSFGASKKGESRLVREEDELGEGEDEHAEYTGATERVPLGEKAGRKAEAMKKAGMEAMILDTEGDIDEDNEEELEWEAAQIRRGGGGGSAMKTTTEVIKQVYRPAIMPEHSTLSSFNTVEIRLLKSLEQVQASLDQQSEAADYFATEGQSLEEQESELRQEVEKEAARQQFFQELNTFVEDINSFFVTKWPALEQAEKDLLSVLTERTELIYKRRYEDLSDDLVLFKSGEVGVLRPVVQGATTPDLKGEDDVRAIDQEEDVDELGRSRRELDTSSQAPSRRARREERLQRRHRRKARVVDPPNNAVDEGYSTDDSLSPADSADLLAASKSLSSSAKTIMADTTNPEFLSPINPNSLSDRFLSWRSRYPEEYGNAFGNLALVQAWEFWARLELVSGLNLWGFKDWIKIDDKRGIENWDWMRGLETFVHKASKGAEEDSAVAAMITTVVIPILIPIISQTYDPFSVTATTKSLELVEQVGYVLDIHNNLTYDQFVMSFLNRFRASLTELKHLAGSTNDLINSLQSQIGMEGIDARNRFLNKCYKLLKQGLRWKKHSKKLVFDQVEYQQPGGHAIGLEYILAHQLVGQIMLPILQAGWETGGQHMAEKINKACPFGLLPADISDALHNRGQRT
ncbi:hypothetical protein CROQUDRAFT_64317 [Cronartium quercuum f. sp. fusiforme G11]|uniref:GCF C-terminal domain-containing protein n=1 Tax=Cronartium quercuum f. sp. fusiforme G11 TaxID=708437 RepID=A0A9P6TBY0_9BASI|nr:hypothetical protein CROQUDRAFT_64317 [Cronartium quercuum f. sp. fusiforme G11]